MKYQRFTPSGVKNIGIRKSEFVTIDTISLIQCFKADIFTPILIHFDDKNRNKFENKKKIIFLT